MITNILSKCYGDDRIIFVHGTWSDPNTFSQEFKDSIARAINDKVQDWIGGTNTNNYFIPKFEIPRNPSQTLDNPNVINVKINQNPVRNAIIETLNYVAPTGSSTALKLFFMQNTHTNMHSDKTVDKYVIPVINNNK